LIERLFPAPLHRALLPIAHAVRHWWRMFAKAPLTGCHVVIEEGSGAILLLRHSYGPKVWALPGGGVEKGEDPMAAARREMAEELDLTLGPLECAGTLEDIVSGSAHIVHVFGAVADQSPRPDQREVVEAKFFDFGVLPQNISPRTSQCLALWQGRKLAQTAPE